MRLLICLALATQEAPQPRPAEEAAAVHFESHVRPILVEHCHKCHGPQKQWAGLRLDSRDALLKGGDSGPAIVPGHPEESLLIRAVRHLDENLRMPEDGRLTDHQIAALSRWIQAGAVFPQTLAASDNARRTDHWAFQPPQPKPVPAVRDATWPQSPIDHFVLARLEAEQLSPAPPAGRHDLIRRATFDLTGLPPTPEEISDFVNDSQPGAFHRLVDRLLDSPAYGERWGRHWLDVVRYADSNGLDENIAHGNAWRYRDYVVQSINQDKPFDRFLIEQLAGDLLPSANDASRVEHLIATGFLSIGPKVLAEVDQAKMRMDIVDEQIDTVGRAFLGLTLGCARCHDHKFDPIATADYYGLAGIFKSTRTMDTYTKVARWHEHLLPTAEASRIQADYDARLLSQRTAIASLIEEADRLARAGLPQGVTPPDSLEPLYPESTRAELAKMKAALAALETEGPDLPSAMGVSEDTIVDEAIHIRGDPLKLGEVVARHTPPAIRGATSPQFSPDNSGRRELAGWLTDPANPLTARVLVNRVWRWHFGTGLVRTTDNFGLLGEPPTHPELLDWLALRFISDGWSLKSLHRLILSSAVYQQDSLGDPQSSERDPDNRYLSRTNLRRLSAEEVRDTLLAVSGQLDPTRGGPVLKVKNRGYLFDHTSIDLTDYSSTRRSLYLPVIRNNVYDLFQLLDFPDPAVPNSDRATSTVAPQALLMLNSDFVMQSAEKLAERVLDEPGTAAERMDRLFLTAIGRTVTHDEIRNHESFLTELDAALTREIADPQVRMKTAWTALCHTLLATNEFIYVK